MTAPTAVMPPQLFAPHEMLSMIIHGFSKVGKSTVASSAPLPILVLDAEGSWRFIPLRQVPWDPMTGPPPVYDGTWDVCYVTIREWDTVAQTYKWLTQYQTPFVSVVVDSLSELQRRLKANLKGTEALVMQDWGRLLNIMDNTIRGFRDLTLINQLNVRCVIFTAETRQETGKWRPYMQGQISVSLPYWVDVCGFLYADMDIDTNGQPTAEVRRLLISPHPQYETGERVQGRLGGAVTIPKPAFGTVGNAVTDMMHTVYGHYQNGQNAQYANGQYSQYPPQ